MNKPKCDFFRLRDTINIDADSVYILFEEPFYSRSPRGSYELSRPMTMEHRIKSRILGEIKYEKFNDPFMTREIAWEDPFNLRNNPSRIIQSLKDSNGSMFSEEELYDSTLNHAKTQLDNYLNNLCNKPFHYIENKINTKPTMHNNYKQDKRYRHNIWGTFKSSTVRYLSYGKEFGGFSFPKLGWVSYARRIESNSYEDIHYIGHDLRLCYLYSSGFMERKVFVDPLFHQNSNYLIQGSDHFLVTSVSTDNHRVGSCLINFIFISRDAIYRTKGVYFLLEEYEGVKDCLEYTLDRLKSSTLPLGLAMGYLKNHLFDNVIKQEDQSRPYQKKKISYWRASTNKFDLDELFEINEEYNDGK